MTRDEIMQLARDAGIDFQQHKGITGKWNISTCGGQEIEKMERFAALVEAAEREACVQLCKGIRPENNGVSVRDLPGWILGTLSAADAIQQRGQS